MIRSFTILIFILSQLTTVAQKLPALDTHFSQIRLGKSPSVPAEILNNKRPTAVLEGLAAYYTDTTALIRSSAYGITHQIGIASKESAVRQQAVQQLIDGAGKDSSPGNVGIAFDYLTTFNLEDFSDKSKDDIGKLLTIDQSQKDKVFKLAGFLQLTSLKESIRPFMQPGNARGERWAAIVALTRMNDVVALQDMLVRAKKAGVNDAVVDDLFPDIVYTRHKVAYSYLLEILKSDEKNCTSAGENEAPILCGYRIMEQLAKAVKNYPLELDASGDIKTKDYKKALLDVRAWFDAHPDYELNANTY